MDYSANILILFLVFMFGASIGSFMGLVAVRMNPNKAKKTFKEIFVSPSHDDYSSKKLTPIELIPVFSFLIQKGKSKNVKNKNLPLSYLVLEIVSGLAAVLLFIRFESNLLNLVIFSIVVFSFIYLAYFDYLHWEVQLGLIIFNFFLLLFYYLFQLNQGLVELSFIVERLIACVIGIAFIVLFIILSKGKGLGLGDAWIMGIMGLVLGYFELFVALTIASVSGSLIGLIKAYFFTGKVKGVMIQFVPFLSFGFIITLLYGKYIVDFLYF